MSEQSNVEVGVPTDQPLLTPQGDGEEISTQQSDKNAKKTSDDEKLDSSSGDLSKSKVSVGIVLPKKDIKAGEFPIPKSQSEIQVSVSNSLSVSQTSKNSLMTFSSSGTFYDHSHSKAKKKIDIRITPKRVAHTNGKETTDFRQMEQGLLKLLDDFHCGKLEAFGQDCTFERMENVREQQEKLARLHFDLNAQQELCGQHTDEGINMSKRNLAKLTENLQELSHSIEQLQSGSPSAQADQEDRFNIDSLNLRGKEERFKYDTTKI